MSKEDLKECINYNDAEDECDNYCEIESTSENFVYKCCFNCSKLNTCKKACDIAKDKKND